MLQECKINPDQDPRVFKAFHAHSMMRSPVMNRAAENELTQGQYYRWRLIPSMNSYGCQTLQKLMPEVDRLTDMFVKGDQNTPEFRQSLRVIYDFTREINQSKTPSSKGQSELNTLMGALDLSTKTELQLVYTKLLQHVYHEVAREDADGKRQSLERVMSTLPEEFESVSEKIKSRIMARVYVSNFNMLFDFMDRWAKQMYKDVNEGCMMDNIDAAFDKN